jgi:hypothetical protein
MAVLGVVALTGCGEPESLSPAQVADLRGEPIFAELPAASNSADAASASWPPVADSDLADSGLLEVGFDLLSGYDYESAAAALGAEVPARTSAVPEAIRALDGRQVAIKGFMLPLTLEGGLVTELLLMRDQSMCCFGVIPRLNDWISVKMAKPGVKATLDQPVTLLGTLHVGEVYENGLLICIYRLDGEQMLDALDL